MTELEKALAQESWRLFPHTFAAKASEGEWVLYRHLHYILVQIADAIYQGKGRIIVNMPPQHGKTQAITRWLTAWHLDRWPDKNVILTTYAGEYSVDLGRAVRDTLNSSDLFRAKVRNDSKSAQRFTTTQGGNMFASGVGGPITGRGGHLMILDDPHKNWEEAHSVTLRKGMREWFDSVFYTRQQKNTTMICVMTRWCIDDMTDFLVKEHGDDWHVIKLKAIAEENDPMGRELGEALCPERYDIDDLMAIKNGTTSAVWSALYQQEPVPQGGNMFASENFAIVDEPPKLRELQLIRYWDMAASNDKGVANQAYSCGVLMGRHRQDGYIYVLHVVRVRKDERMMRKLVRQTADLDSPAIPVAMEQEPGSAGKAVIGYYKENVLPGFKFDGDRPTGQKVVRAGPFASQVEIGKVRLVKGEWNGAYLDEMEAAPGGATMDQVDASSGAFNMIMGKRKSIAQMLGDQVRENRAKR